MQYVRYSSGVRLEWDDTIGVGTLIRTRFKGYWILTEIELQPERVRNPRLIGTIFDTYPIEWSNRELYAEVPIFRFTQVLREDGTASKRVVKECSATYCSRVTQAEVLRERDEAISLAEQRYREILRFVGE